MKEFDKFAVKGRGISSMTLSRYTSILDGYINPTITEERKQMIDFSDPFYYGGSVMVVRKADVDPSLLDEIPPLSLLREFIGGCTFDEED